MPQNVAQDALDCAELVTKEERNIMSAAKLTQCEGFILMTTRKAALGVGVETGRGVLIKRLGDDEQGRPKFSPPVPVEVTRVGVGLSVGYTKLCSVIVLNSNWAVRQVSKGLMVGGHDGNMPVEYNLASGSTQGEIDTAGSKTHRTLKLGSPMNNDLVDCPDGGNKADVYAATSGVMVADISFSGGLINPSSDLLKKLYGEGVTVDDVLSGKVSDVPAEFEQLYHFFSKIPKTTESSA